MNFLRKLIQNIALTTVFIGGGAALITAAVGFVKVGVDLGGVWGGAIGLTVYFILLVGVILTLAGE